MEGLEQGSGTAGNYILSRFFHQGADWQPTTQSQTSTDLGKHETSEVLQKKSPSGSGISLGNPGLCSADTLSSLKVITVAPRSRSSTHKRSQSYDSALGSSVASSNGDAAETVSPTPNYHHTPHSTISTSPTGREDFESIVLEKNEKLEGLLSSTVIAETAEKTWKLAVGTPLQALDLPTRNLVTSITETYLRDLVNIAGKDSRFSFLAHPLNDQEDPSTPCTDQETSSGEQPRPGGGGGGSASKDNPLSKLSKRSLRPNNGDGEGDPDERNHKRPALSATLGKRGQAPPKAFACPFRKQSPTTFHVRDYVKCANQEFKDMASLKKHITSEHYSNQFPCPRCRGKFASSEDVRRHLQNPEPCSLRASPTVTTRLELGISQDTRDILASRKDDRKVNNWGRLWTVLFGDNVPIKDHAFSPVVELEEILVEFNTESPSFIAALDTHLKTLVGETGYEWYRDDIEIIKTFVEQWVRELLDNCRGIPFRPPNNGQDNAHVSHQSQTERVDSTTNGLDHSLHPTNYGAQNIGSLVAEKDASTIPESPFLDLDWTAINPCYPLEPDGTAPLAQHDGDLSDGEALIQQAEFRRAESHKHPLLNHIPASHFHSYLDPMSPPESVKRNRSVASHPTQHFAFPLAPAPSQMPPPTPARSNTTGSTPAPTFTISQPRYTISKSLATLNTLLSRQAFQMSVGPEVARDLHIGQLPFDVAFKKLQERYSVPNPGKPFPASGPTSFGGATPGSSRVDEGARQAKRSGQNSS